MLTETKRKRIRRQLLAWYTHNQRDLSWRRRPSAYRIWISEVMLQQTQVKTVLPYYAKFLKRFPDLAALAQADLGEVLKLWEGLGYYSRARNLHRASQVICEQLNGQIPRDVKGLKALPGIGDYIAAAIASMAFGQAQAVVDGNVKRVLARLLLLDIPVNQAAAHKIFQQAAQSLLETRDPGAFNQAMMELGALVCTPRNPNCPRCPVQQDCVAYRSHQVHLYPRRLPPKAKPVKQMAIGVVHHNGRVMITRRPLQGLLGGLWEFPAGECAPGENTREACVRSIQAETGVSVTIDHRIGHIRHAYTHFRIEADVFLCQYLDGAVVLAHATEHRWIKLQAIGQYPMHKANHKFIPRLARALARVAS